MPLPKINLDDKTFADIAHEAIARIPSYAPDWTNYNPSDPGITLFELFAWLVESQLYRVNKITDAAKINFLKLLGFDQIPGESVDDAILRAQREFRTPTRAVTSDDYECLVHKAVRSSDLAQIVQLCGGISRVKSLPGYHPRQPKPVPGIVTIALVPEKSPIPTNLPAALYAYLDHQYRLLTVELFVMEAAYIDVSIAAAISVMPTSVFDDVKDRVNARLRQFLDPLIGGMDGKGWPFGRGVYIAELFKVIDDVEGVDFVEIAPSRIIATMKDITLQKDVVLQSDEIGNIFIPQHALVRYMETSYVDVSVTVAIRVLPPEVFDIVKDRVETMLIQFLDTFTGGIEGKGWTFGYGIFLSEFIKMISGVEGVNFMEIDGIAAIMNGIALQSDKIGNIPIPQHALVRYGGCTIIDYNNQNSSVS